MTKSHRERAPATLRDLRIDRTLRPVIDELAAVTLNAPTLRDYAGFFSHLPAIVAMTTRAFQHAQEHERFIALTDGSDPDIFFRHVGQLHAVVRLNSVASIAVALIPARSGADRHARREQGHAMLRRLEEPETNELREVIEITFELGDIDADEVTSDILSYITRLLGTSTESRATVHRLEERDTLLHYLETQPDIGALVQDALHHGEMADCFRKSLRRRDLSPEDRRLTGAAADGATLQQRIALARLALATHLPDCDAALDHVYAAINESPPQVAATLILAISVGDRLRDMAAAHPASG
ncbi:hypothetical protein [Bosea sp. (in: a-proteobacteria)]|uniref:hypothetical protein n=1 Tax=Bosea sp. (in: a-proteobacteria) TaxID=1871050 RepID=UPI002B45C7CE|nr:hypothetical protein [Bosea sp. (in: a-proteobacteria)]WRH56103.1 MAG: hypothetical protein RSE11_13675 [Bosea sp. (in: a-proteobacteria)]